MSDPETMLDRVEEFIAQEVGFHANGMRGQAAELLYYAVKGERWHYPDLRPVPVPRLVEVPDDAPRVMLDEAWCRTWLESESARAMVPPGTYALVLIGGER